MNKRIVLWIVFLMSLLLLWERWQTFNGRPSMFFPNTTQQAKIDASRSAPTSLAAAGSAAIPAATGALPGNGAGAAVKGEVITVITDRYKAESDTVGGDLRQYHALLATPRTDHVQWRLAAGAIEGTP